MLESRNGISPKHFENNRMPKDIKVTYDTNDTEIINKGENLQFKSGGTKIIIDDRTDLPDNNGYVRANHMLGKNDTTIPRGGTLFRYDAQGAIQTAMTKFEIDSIEVLNK